MKKTTVTGLVRATHFGPTLAVSTMALVLAFEVGLGAKSVYVWLAILAGQCSVGWSNDGFDAARDRLARRTTKPIVAGLITRSTVLVAAGIAVVTSLGISSLLGWRALLVNVVGLASAWAYNAGLKATVLSPLPYAISFGLLPAFLTVSLPSHPWPKASATLAAGLLGVGAHFINTLKDASADQLTGVRGLPQRLGTSRSTYLGAALLVGALVFIVVLQQHRHWWALVLALVALSANGMVIASEVRHRPDMAWDWTLIAAFVSVVLFATTGGSLTSA